MQAEENQTSGCLSRHRAGTFPAGRLRSLMPLPDIYSRVFIALTAERHGIAVPAAIAPDIKGSAFLAERLAAAIAYDHCIVLPADLADPAFDDLYHEFNSARCRRKIKLYFPERGGEDPRQCNDALTNQEWRERPRSAGPLSPMS